MVSTKVVRKSSLIREWLGAKVAGVQVVRPPHFVPVSVVHQPGGAAWRPRRYWTPDMFFLMDCYYLPSRGAPPELGESIRIYSPSRARAIEDALYRAQRLRPIHFELRDPSGDDNGPFYNSVADQKQREMPTPWPGKVHY